MVRGKEEKGREISHRKQGSLDCPHVHPNKGVSL